MTCVVLVEGHGDIDAAENLLSRMEARRERGARFRVRRWKNLNTQPGISRAIDLWRPRSDVDGMLILRDEDDACPRTRGPEIASWARACQVPFPVAVVLLHPEFEVLFLPMIEHLAGKEIENDGVIRPGLVAGAVWDAATWESRRGVKEWLTSNFPPNRRYKPSTDQLPFTRAIDLRVLENADVPSFGTLQRALDFLHEKRGAPLEVYPPAT